MAQAYRVDRGEESDTQEDAGEREYDALGAAKIKAIATARKSTTAFEGTYYFVVGGWLVRQLAAINAQQKQQGDHTLDRDRVFWKWDATVADFRGMMDVIIEEVLPLIREQQHPQFGILILLDTDMIETVELADMHDALIWMKTQVDAYNREERTDHFVMIGLSHYHRDSRDRYSDPSRR